MPARQYQMFWCHKQNKMKVYFKVLPVVWALSFTSILWLMYSMYADDTVNVFGPSMITGLQTNTDVSMNKDNVRFWKTVSKTFHVSAHVSMSEILKALRHFRITSAAVMKVSDVSLKNHLNVTGDLGSTHKWLLTLEGGQKVIFKPDWKTPDAGYWFENFENPLNELLSFKVDRVFGFNRTPYTVWRSIDIQAEILPVASNALKQFLYRKDGEMCLRDKCYFCDKHLEVCSAEGQLEGVIIYYVDDVSQPLSFPWDVSNYHRYQKYGFNNQTACTLARSGTVFESTEHFFHLMNLQILDLLTNHYDSKYYYIRETAGTSAVFIDRGRANDEYHSRREPSVNIIGLWQCCRVSLTTFERVHQMNWKDARSEVFSSLRKDVIFTENNRQKLIESVNGIEQRLEYVLTLLDKCYTLNQDHIFLI